MSSQLANRFRGFLPVVVDVETGGFESQKDALLEIAMVLISMNEKGLLISKQTIHHHILPFDGSICDPKSLAFNKIDPYHPFRFAISEKEALQDCFKAINSLKKELGCSRAVLVGHNAWFDLSFLRAACDRTGLKNPFHSFTSFDTATLSALAFGQTVLPKALKAAGIAYNPEEAHSAIYDAMRTAELFCQIVNLWPTNP